jgi:hypothetical protein
MDRAEKAGVNRMSGKLDQAFKVRFVGKIAIEQVCKHAASIAFVSFTTVNLETVFCKLKLVSTGEHDLTCRYSWDLCYGCHVRAHHSQIRILYSCIYAVMPHIMHIRQ